MMWPALFVNGLSAENRAEQLTGVRHFLKQRSLSLLVTFTEMMASVYSVEIV